VLRRPIETTAINGDQLARFSIAGAQMPGVKQQYSKVRDNEAFRISWQARIAQRLSLLSYLTVTLVRNI
jgi:hypothetical protein